MGALTVGFRFKVLIHATVVASSNLPFGFTETWTDRWADDHETEISEFPCIRC